MNSLSNFFKQKEKICKCGHNKNEHYKKPKSKWSVLSECNQCKCSSFLDRKRPNTSDKFSMIYGFFVIGLGIFCIFITMPIFDNDQDIKIHSRTVGLVLVLLIILGLVYTSSLITPYFTTKRRKEYPIEKDEQE